MWWIWKLLGYKDEDKEMIKKYQLEKAKEHFKDKIVKEHLSQKQKEQQKPYPKTYADAVKKECEEIIKEIK